MRYQRQARILQQHSLVVSYFKCLVFLGRGSVAHSEDAANNKDPSYENNAEGRRVGESCPGSRFIAGRD